MQTRLLKLLLLTTLASGALRPAAHAGTFTLNAGNNLWNTPGSWSPLGPPGAADTADFTGVSSADLAGVPQTIASLIIGSGGPFDFHALTDSANLGAPNVAWNQLTVATSISKVNAGYASFNSTHIVTPLLTQTGGYLYMANPNRFQATLVNINGGTNCAGAASAGQVFATTWNVTGVGTWQRTQGTLSVGGGGFNVLGGATWSPGCSVDNATLQGNMVLAASARSFFELGPPNLGVSPNSDHLLVAGNLTLGGFLDIADAGGLAAGAYTLFTYSGTLTDNGLIVGAAPPGFIFTVSKTTPGQIKLIVTAGCSYTITAPSGFSMIANQCDAIGGNTLNNVVPAVPVGSQITKWNNTTQAWVTTSTFNGTSWVPGGTLSPGEDAFFFNPGPPISLTFSGNPHTPVLPLPLPASGYCIISRQTPQQPTKYEDIVGQPPLPGDRIYRFVPGQGYVCYIFDDIDLAWTPAAPMVNVGESVWICRGSGGSVPSLCNPDATPPFIDCACLADLAHNLLLTNACQGFIPNLCQFSNCFHDACCLLSCTQSPAAGTPVGPGTYPITITLTDCATNRTTSTNCMLNFVVREPMSGCFRTNAVVPCGAAVVTCFSGQCYLGPGPNPNGPVLVVIDVNDPVGNGATLGNNWAAPNYHGELYPSTTPTWTRANLGEVFGVTLDGQNPPNIFVTAAGFYCGAAPGSPSGPGAVYRVDGLTAAIACHATLTNSGVGLGNICHDPVSGNFFVSDLEDGLIYRVPPTPTCGSTPAVFYDHGKVGRPLATPPLSVISDDATPGATQLGRRVWGVGILGRRLYYSVWNENGENGNTAYYSASVANEIWSVALTPAGTFVGGSAQREITLPAESSTSPFFPNGLWSSPVSHIAFSPDGSRMLLSERSVRGMFPNALIPPANAHIARVLEYRRPGITWVFNQQYQIGDGGACDSSAGGADYACESRVWATGDYLKGPPGYIYGLAGIPTSGNSCATASSGSYLVDLDGVFNVNKTQIGDVVIRRCCDCCVKITDKQVECVSTNMTYQWTFCITNCWTNSIKYFSILDLPPGVTPSEDIFTLPVPLAPGQGTCLTLYLTNKSGLQMTNLCFTVGAHTTNFNVCCSVAHCFALPPCCVWISGDVATPITGQPNCYTYNPGMIKNLSATPVKYLFLVPQPDAPNNCFSFSPNVITFNPPLLPNQTPVAGQMSPATLKLTVTPGCKMPFCFLASLHDSNLVNCCSSRKYITRVKQPIAFPGGFDGSAFLAGSAIPVPVIIDRSVVGARFLKLYCDGETNATTTIVNPTDGQHDDYFVLSNAPAGTHVFEWELTDQLNGAWRTAPATVIAVGQGGPILPPAPALFVPAAALNAGQVRFLLPTEPGVTCHVEYTETLSPANWRLFQIIVGDGTTVTIIDTVTNAPQRFFRVRMP